MNMSREVLACDNCNKSVKEDDEYCPHCGSIFVGDVYCHNHQDIEAKGVCVVCSYAFCESCGLSINDIFICDEHNNYEIYGAMARVYGGSDILDVEYVKNALEQDGLHPFIYSRKASPISLGGDDYTLFRASGESEGRLINEVKVMIPLQELLLAEEIISALKNGNDEEEKPQ